MLKLKPSIRVGKESDFSDLIYLNMGVGAGSAGLSIPETLSWDISGFTKNGQKKVKTSGEQRLCG